MDTVIHASHLTKLYGSNAALSDLNIDIQKGEVFGYLGPNGAGKTTTIRLLLGLINPTSGSATILGNDCQKEKSEVHTHIAYVPGESTLWPYLTGKQTLHLLGKVYGRYDEEYMQTLIEKFQFDPNKKVRAYSKGNRQKITLIAALMTRADILIFDEPTSGLDPLMEQEFRNCIIEAKDRGQTIFLSSHILEEVQALCDRIGILRQGKLIEVGTLAQMRHLSALQIEATFATTPPDISQIEGVHNISISGNMLKCSMQGDISVLLDVISKAKPKTFVSTEPSLEELFMTIYGNHSNNLEKQS